jgi:hypothetical protein
MRFSRRQPDFWVVRGTLRGQDVTLVIEALTRAEAEYSALKKGVDVVFTDTANPSDVREAEQAKMLWRCSPPRRMTCFGCPVTPRQAECLVLLGWAVVVLNLRIAEIPFYLIPPGWV